jgi:pimeloyl-ACP methyl ester carboxylesterase
LLIMSKPVLHFVHANSFPAGTYCVLFRHLDRHYDVRALPMHAHNPAYPVRNNWKELAQELADELVARYSEPVILVGHSMGGMLSLMVAKSHPELVRCVVLLDAPVVAGWRAGLLQAVKALGIEPGFSPARFSEKRRNLWPDARAAFEHYASKPMFAIWPQEVLQDYVRHGLDPHPEGVTLRFTREAETAVYRTLPHHIGRMVRGRFPVPIGFIGGIDSVECRQAGLKATKRLVGPHFMQIPGGHLFPMEKPVAAVEAIHRMIVQLVR